MLASSMFLLMVVVVAPEVCPDDDVGSDDDDECRAIASFKASIAAVCFEAKRSSNLVAVWNDGSSTASLLSSSDSICNDRINVLVCVGS